MDTFNNKKIISDFEDHDYKLQQILIFNIKYTGWLSALQFFSSVSLLICIVVKKKCQYQICL